MTYASVADYLPEGQDGRRALLDRGAELGRNTASTDYPNAVYRDRRQVESQAVQVFQSKEASWKKGSELNQREDERYDLNYWKHVVKRANAGIQGVYDPGYSNYAKFKGKNPKDLLTQFVTEEQNKVRRWDEQVDEARRLFVSAYASAYLEYVQKEDARRAPPPPKPTPPPQPKPQPQPAATPSNTATLQGATFTIRKIEPSADEIVYYLEINHPGVTDGVEVLPLAYPIGNSSTLPSGSFSASFSDVATSSGRALASASSDAVEARGSQFSVKKGSKFYIKK